MAKPILVANWKNYPKSLSEARTLLKGLSRDSRLYKRLSTFVAPPTPYFELIYSKSSSTFSLGSQDIAPVASGTHTSLVTPDILKSFGVRLSIIGHSEVRELGETNEIVAEKIKIALKAGITPLLCVGERARDQDGEHFEFLRDQLKSSLSSIKKKALASKIIIAYEPIWAIGKTASEALKPEDLAQSVIFIKKILSDTFGRSISESIPILYGGSVEPVGAYALCHDTGVRGFLVGHASLNAKNFKLIAEALLTK